MRFDPIRASQTAELEMNLSNALAKYRRLLRREALSCATDALYQWVARGVEWYRATWGWVFILDRNGDLRSIPGATVRSSKRCAWIPKDRKDNSFVWRVLEEGKGDFTNDVSELTRYLKLEEGTRSELAVPIFDEDGVDGGKVIGVCNLEAQDKDAFFPGVVHELQKNVSLMTLHLLVLRYWYNRDADDAWAWHPEAHGWSPGKLMERFCHTIVRAGSCRRTGQPVCSVWNADSARTWTLGNCGYDYEFLGSRVLPSESASWRVAHSDGRGILRGTPKEVGFYYSDKANQMGVKQVRIVSLRDTDAYVHGSLNYYALDERTSLPSDQGMVSLALKQATFMRGST
jgi:hypothetical protein